MNAAVQKPKDPNWVCTFSLVRNKAKTEKKHPDMVLVDSEKMNKEGKPFKKNKSVKITIKKSSSSGPTPAPKADAADWDDQF